MSSSISFNNYLIFDGQAKSAMEFYSKAFDAKLILNYFADVPSDSTGTMSDTDKQRVMHGSLTINDHTSPLLMASDTFRGSPHKFIQGTNYSVSVNTEDVVELEKRFALLSEGATITMPLAETFWALRFGMLTDKFGVQWMFNAHKPKAHTNQPADA